MPLNDFRSICLPYCLQKQPDGTWIVLNREYKPLGFNTNDRVDYGDYPIATKFKGLGPATLDKLDHRGRASDDCVMLYGDGCVPTHSAENMKVYMKKLEFLAKLEVAPKR